MFTCMHKFYTVDQWAKFAADHPDTFANIAISAGTSEDEHRKLAAVIDAVPLVKYICLDVANGYSEHFVDRVRKTREAFPRHTIFAGNVVTGEMVEELLLSGADAVKVGIGPGSVCTTRKQTGVGYPQLSAIIECADAAHGLGGHIIADGGCKVPGDVAKAFGGGSDFVMMGGYFAGYEESGGELVERDGALFKKFYGMSSSTAMLKHSGSVAEYRSSEGRSVEVPFRGPIAPCLLDLLGGIRSTCTYVGASSLKELSKRTTFIRVTEQLNTVFDSARHDSSHGYTSLKPATAAAGGSSGGASDSKAE
jgi:GMP reductase